MVKHSNTYGQIPKAVEVIWPELKGHKVNDTNGQLGRT